MCMDVHLLIPKQGQGFYVGNSFSVFVMQMYENPQGRKKFWKRHL